MVEMREPIQRLCLKCGYMTVTQYGEHLQTVNAALLEALEAVVNPIVTELARGPRGITVTTPAWFDQARAAVRAAKGETAL